MAEREVFDGGVWWIEDDDIHINIPKLLQQLGFANTEENRRIAVEETIKAIRKHKPDASIVLNGVNTN